MKYGTAARFETVLNRIDVKPNFVFTDSRDKDLFCVGGEKFIGLNLLVATYQEGYLFYASSENLKVFFSLYL